METQDAHSLGPVIVTGGCGFIGFHLVSHLLSEPNIGPISVISRKPDQNRVNGVTYHAADINDENRLRELLAKIQPQVIFHAASPSASDPAITPEEHHTSIVLGTQKLLAIATSLPSVKAFIYTSTAAVARGYEHFDVDETAPLWDATSKTIPYFKAKAQADTLVREANTPMNAEGIGLMTCTLRLPLVYGERDTQYIPSQLNALRAGQTKIQLGKGQNKIQPVYAGNVADAHILAAKGLLASVKQPKTPRVDGEAFLIHDGEPQPFWDFTRRTWRHAGDTTKPEEIRVIPGWLALGLASTVEWAFSIFTFGQKRPPLAMNRLYIQYTVYNTTYSIDKARKALGYSPVSDHDGNLKRSIEWELENHKEKWEGIRAV